MTVLYVKSVYICNNISPNSS